jgi:hypothetical protein
LRSDRQQIEIVFVEPTPGIARGLEHVLHSRIGPWNTKDDRIVGPRRRDKARLVSRTDLSQANRSETEHLSDMLLESSFKIVVWKTIAQCIPKCHEQLPNASEMSIGAGR